MSNPLDATHEWPIRITRREQISFGDCPPACHTETLIDEPLTLGSLQEKWETTLISGDDLPAGDYRVTGSYAFTYTDPDDGQLKSGLVEQSATFSLLRVQWAVERAFPGEANVGDPLFGGIVLKNVGNDDARNVRFSEVFRADGTVPVAAVPPGVGEYGAWANTERSRTRPPRPSPQNPSTRRS